MCLAINNHERAAVQIIDTVSAVVMGKSLRCSVVLLLLLMQYIVISAGLPINARNQGRLQISLDYNFISNVLLSWCCNKHGVLLY